MANDILITPGSGSILFQTPTTGTSNITLYVETGGTSGQTGVITFVGDNAGDLFSITDSLEGSLMSVSDISGIPIFEVFANDSIIMGEFGTNALVVSGDSVGFGTNDPLAPVDIFGAGNELRLTYTGGTFSALATDASGDLALSATTHSFYVSGTREAFIDSFGIKADNGNGFGLFNETGGDTNPTILPNRNSTNTGIGGVSTELSLITVGTQAMHISSAQDITIPAGNLTVSDVTTLGALRLNSGDNLSGSNNYVQIAFGYNDTAQFQHFITTEHNSGSITGNAIKFFLNDGTQTSSYPTNAILALSIDGGNVTVPAGDLTAENNIYVSGKTTTVSGTSGGYYFGDGDSGIYESSDDTIIISPGANNWTINSRFITPGTNTPVLSTIASEGIYFTSNTGVRIRANTSNTLYLVTNNTNALTINATQDVTIPAGDLYSSGTTYLSLPVTGSSDQVLIRNESTGAIEYTSLAGLGGGDVTKSGTAADNQIAVWVSDGSIEGDSNFLWTGTELQVSGATTITGNTSVGGQILADDGLQGTPSYSFTSNPDTGMYLNGSDIRFVTDGTHRVIITSLGLVGWNSQSGAVTNNNATSTTPSLLPRKARTTTGIGSGANDEIDLITLGVQALNIDTNQNTTIYGDLTVTGNTFISGTTTFYGDAVLSGTSLLASAASHYIVEAGTNGIVRRKTLANVQSEVVTNSSINTAKPNIVTGTGGANRIAYWNTTSTITSNPGYTYDGTDVTLTTGDLIVSGSTNDSQILMNSGSTSSPAIAFAADPNTGFYWNTDGQFLFASNSVIKYAFDSNRMGSSSSSGPALRRETASLTNATLAPYWSVDSGLGGNSSGDIALITPSGPKWVVETGGNIGFNTTDIESWGSQLWAIEGPESSMLFGRASQSSEIYGASNAYWDGSNWRYKTDGTASTWGSWQATGFRIRVGASGSTNSTISYTTALDVNHDGNFGIGTTDIEAWDSNYIGMESDNSSILFSKTAAGAILNLQSGAYYDGQWRYKTGTDNVFNINLNSSQGLRFRTASSGTINSVISFTEAMRINTTGQVLLSDGNAGAPALSFISDPDTGFVWDSSGQIRFTSNATERWYSEVYTLSSVLGGGARLRFIGTTAGEVQFSFEGDTDTGLRRYNTDSIALQTGGVTGLTINATQDVTVYSGLTIAQTPTSGNSTQILSRNSSTGAIEYTSVTDLATGDVGGSGTANEIAYFSDSNTLTSTSSISQSGGVLVITSTGVQYGGGAFIRWENDAGAGSAATGSIRGQMGLSHLTRWGSFTNLVGYDAVETGTSATWSVARGSDSVDKLVIGDDTTIYTDLTVTGNTFITGDTTVDGRVIVAGGTAALPAIANKNDANQDSGIYFSTSDTFITGNGGARYGFQSTTFRPVGDANKDLGTSSLRWRELYILPTTSGSTSDSMIVHNSGTGALELRDASTLGGEHALGDHTNVTDTGKTNGSMLYYSTGSSEWLDSGSGLVYDGSSLGVNTGVEPETTFDVNGNVTVGSNIYTRADGNRNTRINFATDEINLYTASRIFQGTNSTGVVINPDGNTNHDFRVRTTSETNAFFVDSGANTATLNVDTTINDNLTVNGNATITGNTFVSGDTITAGGYKSSEASSYIDFDASTMYWRLPGGDARLYVQNGSVYRPFTGNFQIQSSFPQHTFYNDNDSGLGYNSANNLSIVTGGQEAINVDSSQNVRITGGTVTLALPSTGSSDQFLTRNASTGVVEYRETSSIVTLKRINLRTTDSTTDFSTGSYVAVPWDSQNYIDSDTFGHTGGTGSTNTRIYFEADGVYQVRANIGWTTDQTGQRVTLIAGFRLNGTTVDTNSISRSYNRGTTYGDSTTTAIATLSVTAGTYLEVVAVNDTTSSAYNATIVTTDTEFNAYRLSTAAVTNTWRPITDTPADDSGTSISANWANNILINKTGTNVVAATFQASTAGNSYLTQNDGSGNFGISSNFHGTAGKDDASSGVAKILLNTNASDGIISLNVGETADTNLTFGLLIDANDDTIRVGNPNNDTGLIGGEGTIVIDSSGNLYDAGTALTNKYSLTGHTHVAADITVSANNVFIGNDNGTSQPAQEITAAQARTILNVADGATIGGSIATDQLAYGSGTDTITGSADLTYDDTTLSISKDAAAGVTNLLTLTKTNSGGVGASNDGSSITFAGELSDSSTANQAIIQSRWFNASSSFQKSQIQFLWRQGVGVDSSPTKYFELSGENTGPSIIYGEDSASNQNFYVNAAGDGVKWAQRTAYIGSAGYGVSITPFAAITDAGTNFNLAQISGDFTNQTSTRTGTVLKLDVTANGRAASGILKVLDVQVDTTPVFYIDTGGTVNLASAPATGSVADNILLRDSSGDIQQIAFGSVNLSDFNDDLTYDNYQHWTIADYNGNSENISSTNTVNFSGGTDIGVVYVPASNRLDISFTGSSGAGTTINNNANNRVITGSDTADTLEAESDFTYDAGTSVATLTTATTNDAVSLNIEQTATSGNGNAHVNLMVDGDGSSTGDPYIQWGATSATYYAMGMDNSDEDKLVIMRENSLTFPSSGTGTKIFELTSGGTMTVTDGGANGVLQFNDSNTYIQKGAGSVMTIWHDSTSASNLGMSFRSQCNPAADTGSNALFYFNARQNDNTVIATRPVFTVDNYTTTYFSIAADGQFTFNSNVGGGGGTTFLRDDGTWASAGGGTIGGTISNDQVAFGAATSDEIEGSSNFTFNGTAAVMTATFDHRPTNSSTPSTGWKWSDNDASHYWYQFTSGAASGDMIWQAGGTTRMIWDYTTGVQMSDNYSLGFGTSAAESEIYSDGIRTYWDLKNGDLYVSGGTLRIQDNGTDPLIYWDADTDWVMGVDNSDLDKFKIQRNTSLSNGQTVAGIDISTAGALTITNASTASGILDGLIIRREEQDANGTTGLGTRITFQIEDSAGNMDTAGYITCAWNSATSTDEDSYMAFSTRTYDPTTSAMEEVMRLHSATTTDDPAVSIGGTGQPTSGYNLELFGASDQGRAGDWTATSDRRLKENFKPYGKVLDKISQLDGKLYTYNRIKKGPEHIELGMIAQEVLPVFPEIVGGNEEQYYDISYQRMATINMQGIIELKKENESLKNDIKYLKEEIEKLKNK